MKVDIWSDIMCPFCYIGKRKLEKALEQFPHRDDVQIVWHSFQLDPTMQNQPGKNIYEYLAERKGQSLDWSKKMHEHVAGMAKAEGLDYNFDRAVIANSFDAHRLLQLAKEHGLGDAAEELLFRAYFTDGQDISNHDTLTSLGKGIGLAEAEIKEALGNSSYAEAVQNDIEQAEALGIRGVPFFVIDNKYGISGAQPSEVFADGLQQAWKEYEQTYKITQMNTTEGAACTSDGGCDPVK